MKNVLFLLKFVRRLYCSKIANRLYEAGYNVFIDLKYLCGDIMEAVTKLEEESAAILLCLSEAYNEDRGGWHKTIAVLGRTNKKTIIPITVQQDFQPHGWLSKICCYSMC